MKKTLNVNVGGQAFTLDEDAYQQLKTYLDEIGIRLDGHENQEILEDIESRIADIFQENLSTRVQVVSLEVVKRAMAIIGSAREFGEPRRRPFEIPRQEPPAGPKRFTRSRSDRIIGGVCGGLAEYYDLDPLMVRILTVVLTAFTGVPLFVYLVLWMVMPSAPATGPTADSNYN